LYGAAYKSGYVTQGVLVSGSKYTKGSFIASNVQNVIQMQCNYRYSQKQRAILSTVPYPLAPTFDPRLGINRLTSALSLVVQSAPRRH
jgi:hypothetical protein